jgi:hypothetical protein
VKRGVVLGAAAVVAVGLATLLIVGRSEDAPKPPPELRPLAVIPPGPALVVSVDVKRLRATRSGQVLLGKGLAALAGAACESTLAADLDELALAMPAGDALGGLNSDALALVADGRFLGAGVVACAETRIGARGGEPVKTTIGSFTSVRARRHSGEIVARDGLLVVSDGSYLRDLIDAADVKRTDGTPAERERDALHTELRRVVGRGAPIIATLVLPEGWLAHALADPATELSPLARIRTAALRAELTDHVAIAGIIGTESAEASARLERFFDGARTDLTTLFPASTELFARVHFERHDARIDFNATLTDADLAALAAELDGAADAGAPDAAAQRDGDADAGAPDAARPQSQAPKPEPSGKHD